MSSRPVVVTLVAVLVGLGGGCKDHLSVEPAHGTYAGGDTVTVHADGLFKPGTGGLVVYFGKKKSPSVIITSENDVQVVTPPGDADSTVDIEVDLPDGRRYGMSQAFNYVDTSAGNVWGNKTDGGGTQQQKK